MVGYARDHGANTLGCAQKCSESARQGGIDTKLEISIYFLQIAHRQPYCTPQDSRTGENAQCNRGADSIFGVWGPYRPNYRRPRLVTPTRRSRANAL